MALRSNTLKILLASNHFFSWTGSELSVYTLARQLIKLGHEVAIFGVFVSPMIGGSPAWQALNILSDKSDVQKFAPDVCYSQHHPTAAILRYWLPETPIAHALLGVLPFLESPPLCELGISKFLAISEEVLGRSEIQQLDIDRFILFRNLVDDELFSPVDRTTDKTRVISFSYKLSNDALTALKNATDLVGMEFVNCNPATAGSVAYTDIPAILHASDIVVCSGRSAIETMLCGRTPLIMADCGDDGLVNLENVDELRRCNFSGRSKALRFQTEDIVQCLTAYLDKGPSDLRSYAKTHFGTSCRLDEIDALFRNLSETIIDPISTNDWRTIAHFSDSLLTYRNYGNMLRYLHSQNVA